MPLRHGAAGQAEVRQGGEHQPVLQNVLLVGGAAGGWLQESPTLLVEPGVIPWPGGESPAAGRSAMPHSAPHQPRIFPAPWDHSCAETDKRVFPCVAGLEPALGIH